MEEKIPEDSAQSEESPEVLLARARRIIEISRQERERLERHLNADGKTLQGEGEILQAG
jgi:hypothetical protein